MNTDVSSDVCTDMSSNVCTDVSSDVADDVDTDVTDDVDTVYTQPLSQLPMVMDVPRRRRPRNRELSRHGFALGSMAVGTVLVLGLVIAMNSAVEPPTAKLVEAATDFAVEKKPPPKKQKAPKPNRTKRVKSAAAPRAPLPNVASVVGGVDFDLPGVEGADLGSLGQSLLGDANRNTAMTADSVDEPPKTRRRVLPQYPNRARERGIEGYVTLKLKVSSGGDVSSVRVVEAKPKGVFEQVAVASVQQWQFDPGMYEGQPVETWVNQTVRFRLN